MLRKISHYFAVIALSLIVAGVPVSANPSTTSKESKIKTVTIDVNKASQFYQETIHNGGKHSYTIKVEAGKEVKIKVRSMQNLALKIQTPDGETKSDSREKFFEVKLRAAGEYVVELEALSISQYSLEISSR